MRASRPRTPPRRPRRAARLEAGGPSVGRSGRRPRVSKEATAAAVYEEANAQEVLDAAAGARLCKKIMRILNVEVVVADSRHLVVLGAKEQRRERGG